MAPLKRRPTTPGKLLQDLMTEYGLSQVALARHLWVPVGRIRAVLKGRSRVDAGLALRLSKAFGTSPELWLNLQTAVDLYDARAKEDLARVMFITYLKG